MPTSSSNELTGGLAQQLHTFGGCARFIVAFCTVSVETISAVGFSPASKLFVCMRNGGCCALTRLA